MASYMPKASTNTAGLKGTALNWPNRLTVLRILLVPAFITAIAYHRLEVALCIFIVASATDALDGYLARGLKQKTEFGAIMDPIADKLLLNSAFICFSLVSSLPAYLKMPLYVPIVIISRDVIILLGAMVIYLLNGKIEARPTMIGKVTTFFQMLTIVSVLLRYIHSSVIWNAAAILTLVSGLDYIRIGMRQINAKP